MAAAWQRSILYAFSGDVYRLGRGWESVNSWSLIECGITCVFFIKFALLVIITIITDLENWVFLVHVGLFIAYVRLKESQKSCSTFASFSSAWGTLQLKSARIKIGIFLKMSLLGERETQIIFETVQRHIVSSIDRADNKMI